MIQQPVPPGDSVIDELTNEITVTVDEWSTGQIGVTDVLIAAGVIAVALIVGWIVRRVARRHGARQEGIARSAVEMLGQLVAIGIGLFAFAVALEVLGFGLGPVVVLVVLVAIAVLFLRPMFDNLSTGLLLQVRGVFNLGDVIETHGVIGTVDEITSRSVIINTSDGRRVHIPNSDVLNNVITNHTALGRRRSMVEMAVAATADVNTLDSLLRRVASSVEGILSDPPPEVLVDRLDGTSAVVRIRFWHAPTPAAEAHTRDRFTRDAVIALTEVDISLSDPGIVVATAAPNTRA